MVEVAIDLTSITENEKQLLMKLFDEQKLRIHSEQTWSYDVMTFDRNEWIGDNDEGQYKTVFSPKEYLLLYHEPWHKEL